MSATNKEMATLLDHIATLSAELAEARAELASVRGDAGADVKRMDFLRKRGAAGLQWKTGDRLNAAIDAAIAGEGGNG